MKFDPAKHHRRSIRLKEYDYSAPGAYFVTICVQDHECLLGEIVDGRMELSDWGLVARRQWERLPERFTNVRLDEYTIMPNHIHGIIWLVGSAETRRGTAEIGITAVELESCRAPMSAAGAAMREGTAANERNIDDPISCRAPTIAAHQFSNPIPGSLPAIVRAFKASVAKRINARRGAPGAEFWQRNYWEHVIRDQDDLHHVREYVSTNPARWAKDQLYPETALK